MSTKKGREKVNNAIVVQNAFTTFVFITEVFNKAINLYGFVSGLWSARFTSI
ncbi:MAG: hypothetical protein ABI237_01705 [Ginsengibacter sp.]